MLETILVTHTEEIEKKNKKGLGLDFDLLSGDLALVLWRATIVSVRVTTRLALDWKILICCETRSIAQTTQTTRLLQWKKREERLKLITRLFWHSFRGCIMAERREPVNCCEVYFLGVCWAPSGLSSNLFLSDVGCLVLVYARGFNFIHSWTWSN